MSDDAGVELKPGTIQHIHDRETEHQERVSKKISDYGIVSRFAKIPGIHGVLNRLARHDVATDLRIERLREKAKNAFIDHLTEIPNRRGFNETYKLEVERAIREGHPLSLMFLDIDGFKDINDSKGHHAGDKVLRTVAKILKHSLRRIDLPARLENEEDAESENNFIGGLARMGGDEFILLLPGTTPEGAQNLWERIKPQLMEHDIKMSAGAALVNIQDPRQSLIDADQAMYTSKKDGDGNLRIWTN
jgi:GGDEF domain-containing protein